MKNLKKFIPVDIFGSCGRQQACSSIHRDNCIQVSLHDYKFYFSAENSICREYFTGFSIILYNLIDSKCIVCRYNLFYHHMVYIFFLEKLLRPLENNMVPVVYGSDDAYKVAPPYSFIDVRHFNSSYHLAQYLLYLDRNDTAYLLYFKWKERYHLHHGRDPSSHLFNRFCELLFTNVRQRILWNFTRWFMDDSFCKRATLK